MPARKFNHLRHFGLRNLEGKDATDSDPVAMHVQHDLNRFIPRLVEEVLEYMNHKFHRRVIVVEQQNLIQARPFRFRARLRCDAGSRPVLSGVSALVLAAHVRN